MTWQSIDIHSELKIFNLTERIERKNYIKLLKIYFKNNNRLAPNVITKLKPRED
jgi:hypothetical protein